MRTAVNVFAVGAAAAAIHLALLPAPSLGAEESARDAAERRGADRWIPSFALISGVTVQEWSGSNASSICRGCTFPDPTEEPLRDPQFGSDRDVTPYVGGSVELMTPELPLPLSPRLFVGGEMAAAFGFERSVANEGDPNVPRSPLPEGSDFFFSEDRALGQGTDTVAEFESQLYGAHVGVAFPFELFGRQMRVKPSFAWLRYDIHLEGLVVDAECLEFFQNTRCNTTSQGIGFLRSIRLSAEDDKTLDGIGPGVDLEMDTGRFGPFGTSLFLGGRVYKLLGDRTVGFEAPVESFDDAVGVDEARAEFSFEVDEWMYRVGLGLRLHWVGWR